MWYYQGQKRPRFADEPAAGQESVWDYPRPPRLVPDRRHIEVRLDRSLIADSIDTYRILETASPPTFYIPPKDVHSGLLESCPKSSICEWKGVAQYWMLKNHLHAREPVGWSYADPNPPFATITGYFSFYPSRVECYVDGERVQPQSGGFYGGWVTSEIVGPFKGGSGTQRW